MPIMPATSTNMVRSHFIPEVAAQQTSYFDLPKSETCRVATSSSCPPLQQQPIPDWLFEDEYQEEAMDHMLTLEARCAPELYMIDSQPEICWDGMRAYLIDFLIEVHQSYKMPSEAVLYQTCNIIDRYMSKRVVMRKHFQLLACCCLMLACKYDSAKAPIPTIRECRALCHYAFERPAFVQMMNHILATLNWSLGMPTINDWLAFKCAALRDSPEVDHVARYLAQYTLYHRAFVGTSSASIAAACHAMARTICGATAEPTVSSIRGPSVGALQTLHQIVTEQSGQVSSVLSRKFPHAARLVHRHFSAGFPSPTESTFSMDWSSSLPASPALMSISSSRQSSISTGSGASVPPTPPVTGTTDLAAVAGSHQDTRSGYFDVPEINKPPPTTHSISSVVVSKPFNHHTAYTFPPPPSLEV